MGLRREKPHAHRRVVWQAASLLLAYPDEGQPGGLDMVRAAVNALAENDRAPLLRRPPVDHTVDHRGRRILGDLRLATAAHAVPHLLVPAAHRLPLP